MLSLWLHTGMTVQNFIRFSLRVTVHLFLASRNIVWDVALFCYIVEEGTRIATQSKRRKIRCNTRSNDSLWDLETNQFCRHRTSKKYLKLIVWMNGHCFFNSWLWRYKKSAKNFVGYFSLNCLPSTAAVVRLASGRLNAWKEKRYIKYICKIKRHTWKNLGMDW